MHHLRTHTRRFEATVEALDLDGRRNERRLLSDLGRLRKRAGRLRDMDVLTGYTATVTAHDEQDCLVELLVPKGFLTELHLALPGSRSPVRMSLTRASSAT